ncbi:MAG: hypothetical protein D6B28_10165 [Gammaproteobacteria bacterium]|nr:MAG: hypothetical protein D6B28_10165 [Gammaproteobacteria bacterium]
MNDIKEMLFSMQKFEILSQFANTSEEKRLSAPYVYAWEKGVFPILDEIAPWHLPFAELFLVKKEMIQELIAFLQERYDKGIKLSFYEVEEHYGIKVAHIVGDKGWSRFMLAHACRYLCLHKKFDEEFWAEMVDCAKCPIETKCIIREYTPDEITFE